MKKVFLHVISKLKIAFAQWRHLPQALALVSTDGKGWMVAQLILICAQGLLPVGLIYLTKKVVDSLAFAIHSDPGSGQVQNVIWLGLAIGVMMAAGQVLGSLEQMIRDAQAERLQDRIHALIHEKSIQIDLDFYEQPEYFDHLHRARDEATYRPLELINQFANLLRNSVTLIGMGAVLSRFGFWLPLALLLSTLPALLVVVSFTQKLHDWRRHNTSDRRRSSYYDWLLTSSDAAAELRLFELGEYFKTKFEAVRRRLRKERLRVAIHQRLWELIASTGALLLMAGAVIWMMGRVFRASSTLGDLVLFYQAFNQGQSLMRSLLQNVGQLYANSLFLGDLFEYLSLEPKIVSAANCVQAPKVLQHEITFDGITFSYHNRERVTLNDFNLTIPAKKIVAIVGANGAGKSTLLKLLCRLYDPDAGTIKFDGVDVRDFSVEELRRMTTVLFQSPVHYSATVKENIEIGNLNADLAQKQVEAAAKSSGADVTIELLPDRYESLLGSWFPGGTELSTGEWQRIALARAFLRDSPLILLDEPTSSMDPWAETDWVERLLKRAVDRTVIIVTHRFTTAMYADVIHVMQDGRIIESGSHDELLSYQGRYAESWASQMRHVAAT